MKIWGEPIAKPFRQLIIYWHYIFRTRHVWLTTNATRLEMKILTMTHKYVTLKTNTTSGVQREVKLKLKSVPSIQAHQAGAYPSFSGVKQLRVQYSPWIGRRSISRLTQSFCWYTFSAEWAGTMWNKVSCSRTHTQFCPGIEPTTLRLWVQHLNHWAMHNDISWDFLSVPVVMSWIFILQYAIFSSPVRRTWRAIAIPPASAWAWKC